MIRLLMIYVGLFGAAALGLWLGPSEQMQAADVPVADVPEEIATTPEVDVIASVVEDAPPVPEPVVADLPDDAAVVAVATAEVQSAETPDAEPTEVAVSSSAPVAVEIPQAPVVPAEPEEAPAPRVAILPEAVEPAQTPAPAEAVAEVPRVEIARVAPTPTPAEPQQPAVRPEPTPAAETPPPSQKPIPVPAAEPTPEPPRLPLAPVIEALIAQAALEAETRPDNASGTYVVQPGDSLLSIARVLYGDSDAHRQIFEANRDLLPSIDAIQTGQTLRLP